MIYTPDFTTNGVTLRIPREYLEQPTEQQLEGLPELIRVVVNQAMRIERENYLQAKPYERNEYRQGHANGYKPKTVKTRVGDKTFAIPQVRKGGLYSSALEKGMRSERALLFAVAEMYVQGVSTRKVEKSFYQIKTPILSDGKKPSQSLYRVEKSFDQSKTLIISELVGHDAGREAGSNYSYLDEPYPSDNAGKVSA